MGEKWHHQSVCEAAEPHGDNDEPTAAWGLGLFTIQLYLKRHRRYLMNQQVCDGYRLTADNTPGAVTDA